MRLTLIVPCFNEGENIAPFFQRVKDVFTDAMPQLVFVDDGSTDGTAAALEAVFAAEKAVKVISFSRNFGKEAAILAGLRAADGDLIGIIDADLQQDPSVARDMAVILEKDHTVDMVAAYQESRKESDMHRFFKGCFYTLAKTICDVKYHQDASDFRVFRRKVADAILSLPEKERFSKGIFSWVGFPTRYLPYMVLERQHGKSKWSFFGLARYAMDGILSFSRAPFLLSLLLSALCFAACPVSMVLNAIFRPGVTVSVLLPILFLLFSALFFVLWILGEYLGKVLTEAKDRPGYIILRTLEHKGEDHAHP